MGKTLKRESGCTMPSGWALLLCGAATCCTVTLAEMFQEDSAPGHVSPYGPDFHPIYRKLPPLPDELTKRHTANNQAYFADYYPMPFIGKRDGPVSHTQTTQLHSRVRRSTDPDGDSTSEHNPSTDYGNFLPFGGKRGINRFQFSTIGLGKRKGPSPDYQGLLFG